MRSTASILLGSLLLGLGLGGCASSQGTITTNPVPRDFTLEVRDTSRGTDKAALFIVEPDRWFRAAIGTMPESNWYPPATRQLTPDQMASVWGAFEPITNLEPDRADDRVPTIVVDAMVQNTRFQSAFDPEVDQSGKELLALLRRLAWLED